MDDMPNLSFFPILYSYYKAGNLYPPEIDLTEEQKENEESTKELMKKVVPGSTQGVSYVLKQNNV